MGDDNKDWGEFLDPEQMMDNLKKSTTFKDIVMLQLKRISEIGSKQLRKGYVEKKIIQGQVLEKYFEDGREAYCNSIEMLHDLMIGECENNKKFQEAFKKLEEDEKRILEKDNKIENPEKKLNAWLNHKVKERRRLLKELSRLLFSTDFLAAKTYTDTRG